MSPKQACSAIVAVLIVLGVETWHRAHAQEVQTLSSPITFANTTGCKLVRFSVVPSTDDVTKAVVIVEMAGTGSSIGQSFSVQWDATTNPTGQTLVNQLNKANFSAGNDSLLKQIFTKTGNRGVCVGTTSGTPQH